MKHNTPKKHTDLPDELIKIPDPHASREFPRPADWVIFGIILMLIGSFSFGLGRLSMIRGQQESVRIEQSYEYAYPFEKVSTIQPTDDDLNETINEEGVVIASKNGSKYHFPWCSGAQRILEKNKVVFATNTEARAAGYEPAANCKGLD